MNPTTEKLEEIAKVFDERAVECKAEKQATGYVMTSGVYCVGDSHTAICYQSRRIVFVARGCESRQHAEQIARDICVRYAMIERPTI